jgi:hypothetical protein
VHPLPQIEPVTLNIGNWHAYDASVKADLFSTVLTSKDNAFLIDPIPLDPASLERLTHHTIRRIIVTNQNHWRGSSALSAQLSVPIFAHPEAAYSEMDIKFSPITQERPFISGLQVIAIDGAAPGEIAISADLDPPLIIVGDALINFEPYGFTFLPTKYCVDHRKMRRSLTRLLDFQFDQMFFAHGFPILAKARKRLEDLLNSG